MSERKIWKQEEDQILKQLYEIQQIKRWSEISKIMESKYGIEGRNGKQCRQRYHNHLKGGINKEKWSKQEEQRLVDLHVKLGNRWAMISKLIQGRTQNCVKNMLYSKLRKSVRQLNRFSYQYYRKTLKQIKINFIYRLIEFTENSYKKEQVQRTQQQHTAIRLKNQILILDYEDSHQISQSEKDHIKSLIEEIHHFKKMNQRFRGNFGCKTSKKKNIGTKTTLKEQQHIFQQQSFGQELEIIEFSIKNINSSKQQMKEKIEIKNQVGFSQSILKPIEGTKGQFDFEKEPINVKNDSKIKKLDSLESNFSLLLVDKGLQKPIQTQNVFANILNVQQNELSDWNNPNSWINASRSYQ